MPDQGRAGEERVEVRRSDVKHFLDLLAENGMLEAEDVEPFERLWEAVSGEHEPDNPRGVWCCDDHRRQFQKVKR